MPPDPGEPGGERRRITVVTALGIFQILAWGSSYYLLAVLAAPIARDTGWSLAWIVGALSLGLLVEGLVAPFVGDAIERHGGRPVLAASTLLLAAGLAAMALAPSLPVFVAAWLVVGLGMGAGLLRRRVLDARPPLRAGRAAPDHLAHALRRLRQHALLAALGASGIPRSAGAAPAGSMPRSRSPSACLWSRR